MKTNKEQINDMVGEAKHKAEVKVTHKKDKTKQKKGKYLKIYTGETERCIQTIFRLRI